LGSIVSSLKPDLSTKKTTTLSNSNKKNNSDAEMEITRRRDGTDHCCGLRAAGCGLREAGGTGTGKQSSPLFYKM
jgi:hypothetical protein